MIWRQLRRAIFAALLPLLACHCTAAQGADESEVKAAVIYNLLLFVQWPEQSPSPRSFRFCVLDNGALTTALRGYETRKVQRLAFEIHRLASPYEELDSCAAVMVEVGDPVVLTRIVVSARSRPLLVIAEGMGAADRGAMIGLHTDGGRVTFDINHGAMKRNRLSPSSKILRLARSLIE